MSTEAPMKPRAAKQVSDPEIKALAEIDEIMAELPDVSACRRVLNWLADRYDVDLFIIANHPIPEAP